MGGHPNATLLTREKPSRMGPITVLDALEKRNNTYPLLGIEP
jgi:hypothetical protein